MVQECHELPSRSHPRDCPARLGEASTPQPPVPSSPPVSCETGAEGDAPGTDRHGILHPSGPARPESLLIPRAT